LGLWTQNLDPGKQSLRAKRKIRKGKRAFLIKQYGDIFSMLNFCSINLDLDPISEKILDSDPDLDSIKLYP
jgi:hypothetical protein